MSANLTFYLCRYPQRVSKLKAIVRYMFHNPEDVKWFKASIYLSIFSWHCRLIQWTNNQGGHFGCSLLSCGQNMDAVAGSRRLLAHMVCRLTNNPFDNTCRIVLEDPCYLTHFSPTIHWAGAMKCIFNSSIQQHDTVCMSLFKRAYPKWPEQLYQV